MASFDDITVNVKGNAEQATSSVNKLQSVLRSLKNAINSVRDATAKTDGKGITDEVQKTSKAVERLKRALSAIKGVLSNAFKKTGDSLKTTTSGIKEMLGGIGKTTGRIGKLMLIRQALRGIINAVKEGVKNLYEWDKALGMGDFAMSIDRAKDGIIVLKNSLAVITAPAIQWIANGIAQIARWAMTAANAISRLWAMLGGKSTYRAVKWVDGISASMDGVAGSARKATEEFKRQLLAFDEINNLTPETDKGGGGGGGAGDIGAIADMFEQLETYSADALERWKEVKAEYEKGFDGSPRSFIQGADPTGKGHMTTAWLDWDTLREKSAESWGRLRTYLQGDDPTGKGHLTDWWLGVKAYLQGDDPTGKGHMTSFWWDDLDKFLQKFSGGKNGHLVNIEPNAGFWTEKWDALKKKMSKIKWSEILKSNPTGAGSLREAVSNAMGKSNPFQPIKQKWDELCKDFENVVKYIKDGDWDGLFNYIKEGFKETGDESGTEFSKNITSKTEVLKTKIPNDFDIAFQEGGGRVKKALEQVNPHLDGFQSKATRVSSNVRKTWSGDMSTLKTDTDKSLNDKTGILKIITDINSKIQNPLKGVSEKVKTYIKNPLEEALNSAKNLFNKDWRMNVAVDGNIHFNKDDLNFTIQNAVYNAVRSAGGTHYYQKFASGGYPTTGQMFIAREAGPELVGTIGGQTAVVNNQDIVSAVSTGVANAVASVMGSGQNVTVVLEGDAKGLFKAVQKEARGFSAQTGKMAFA